MENEEPLHCRNSTNFLKFLEILYMNPNGTKTKVARTDSATQQILNHCSVNKISISQS